MTRGFADFPLREAFNSRCRRKRNKVKPVGQWPKSRSYHQSDAVMRVTLKISDVRYRTDLTFLVCVYNGLQQAH